MIYTAINHKGFLAIVDRWTDNYDKPVRGRCVWVSTVPWVEAYANYSVYDGYTGVEATNWALETSPYNRLHFQTPTFGLYEEGEAVKQPREVKGQTKPWKYRCGRWDRFYQD